MAENVGEHKITSIQFKRGEKSVLEARLTSSDLGVPIIGEPIFETDTKKLKIGDGVSDYADLPYIGNGTTPEDIDVLIRGYYKESDGKFYPTQQSTDPLPKLRNKIYLDVSTGRLFTYVVETGQSILDGSFIACVTYGTSDKAGIVKLYGVLGDNTDGTMTQKAITDSINTINFTVESVDNENCLILQRPSNS